jgi:hypothetical protein
VHNAHAGTLQHCSKLCVTDCRCLQGQSHTDASISLCLQLQHSCHHLGRRRSHCNISQNPFVQCQHARWHDSHGKRLHSSREPGASTFGCAVFMYDQNIELRAASVDSWTPVQPHATCDMQLVTCDSPVGRLGLSVCYDLRFPHLYQTLVTDGQAQVLSVPSAFTRVTGVSCCSVLRLQSTSECEDKSVLHLSKLI